MEITWRVFSGEGEGKNGLGKSTGNRQHNWWAENRWGKVKNGIGNREVKELTCTTHEHELRGGNAGGLGGTGRREDKGGEIGKTVIA